MVPNIGFHPRKKKGFHGVFSSRKKGLILVNSLKTSISPFISHSITIFHRFAGDIVIGYQQMINSPTIVESLSNSYLKPLSKYCRTIFELWCSTISQLSWNDCRTMIKNYKPLYRVSLNECWLYGDCRTIMGYPDPNHKVPQPMDMSNLFGVSHPHRTRLGWCHCCWSCALRYSPRCWARCVRRKMRREPRRRWWETRSELALLGRTSQGANGHCSNGGKWWTRIGSLTG